MLHNRALWFIGTMILLMVSGGCHLERGKLYFDEVGLDPITVYNMAPLERTVYCLAEARGEAGPAFTDRHAAALAEMLNNPEKADWSELVCLSLSSEATPEQLRQTLDTLDKVLSRQPQQSNPLSGFARIMRTRLELYDQIKTLGTQIEMLELKLAEQAAEAKQSEKTHEQITGELQNRIEHLEQQVRKLKEVELLLHPVRP